MGKVDGMGDALAQWEAQAYQQSNGNLVGIPLIAKVSTLPSQGSLTCVLCRAERLYPEDGSAPAEGSQQDEAAAAAAAGSTSTGAFWNPRYLV